MHISAAPQFMQMAMTMQVLVRITLRCINPTGGHIIYQAAVSCSVCVQGHAGVCITLLYLFCALQTHTRREGTMATSRRLFPVSADGGPVSATPPDSAVLLMQVRRALTPDVRRWTRVGCRCAGAEAVGVVEELGPGTSKRLTKGQRVVAADWGQVTYQEYVAVDEKNLVRLVVTPPLDV